MLVAVLATSVFFASAIRLTPDAISGDVIGSVRHSRSLADDHDDGGWNNDWTIASEPGAPFEFETDEDQQGDWNQDSQEPTGSFFGDNGQGGHRGDGNQQQQDNSGGGAYGYGFFSEGFQNDIQIVPRIGISGPCEDNSGRFFGQRAPGQILPCTGGTPGAG